MLSSLRQRSGRASVLRGDSAGGVLIVAESAFLRVSIRRLESIRLNRRVLVEVGGTVVRSMGSLGGEDGGLVEEEEEDEEDDTR